ncbi:MAG TPA: helix-hairpin-helix domain-containing protein [Gemmatimonadaceae bacterium]|nr:helix-hairpin-helix domain-containing protein [Gemmatimonadaceae bacterium]
MPAGIAASVAMPLSNEEIAERLEEVANLLEEQGANQYRVQAWRGGAATVRRLLRPVRTLVRAEGVEGVDRLPGIGPALARAIRELVETGRLSTLERLRGESDPVALLASVPGIGHVLGARIHDEAGIDSLEELELAAHDGRLARLGGFGPKRLAGIRDALATRLRARRRAVAPEALPSVAELLDVDREYRDRGAAGELPTIAPRRFNPSGERWLPILHTTRGPRHYTVLFSNTATAHRLGRTHDWVVIYVDGRDGERQCTVVTAARGPLAKRRVVRGREAECLAHYHVNAA